MGVSARSTAAAGLVIHHRQGREVLYALERRRLEEARDFLETVSAGWDRAIVRLREVVGSLSPCA
jgi:hypothetical protein